MVFSLVVVVILVVTSVSLTAEKLVEDYNIKQRSIVVCMIAIMFF